MGFTEKFIYALTSTDLRDDEFHHMTDALQASARAEKVARDLGSRLSRVKYASTLSRQFEDGDGNLANLCREWLAIVAEKGAARKWIKTEDIPNIGQIAAGLYRRVAEASLSHYLDGKCVECHGSKVSVERRVCGTCKGTGEADLPPMRAYEAKLTMDMVGELMSLESSHSGAASVLLRREG